MRYRERLSVPWWWWPPGLGLAGLIALEVNQGVQALPNWVPFAVLLPIGKSGRGYFKNTRPDEMLVKVIAIDRATGKIRLSRKATLGENPAVVHNFRIAPS